MGVGRRVGHFYTFGLAPAPGAREVRKSIHDLGCHRGLCSWNPTHRCDYIRLGRVSTSGQAKSTRIGYPGLLDRAHHVIRRRQAGGRPRCVQPVVTTGGRGDSAAGPQRALLHPPALPLGECRACTHPTRLEICAGHRLELQQPARDLLRRQALIVRCSFALAEPTSILRGFARSLTGSTTLSTPLS